MNCVSCIEMDQSGTSEHKISMISLGNTQFIKHTAEVSESQRFAQYTLLGAPLRSDLEQAFRILSQHDVNVIN